MKRLAALGALGLMACQIYAQGLNPSPQTKNDWEEINFEFNSAILSDGYPSLLRLADLLSQHRDYKVRITGHTDFIGSERVNQRLALARANTVRDFLVKYGVSAGQITTESQGKNSPEVSNNSREGRFVNRRVVLTVTNAQGQVIKEGGIGEVINAVQPAQPPCCDEVLQQLKKLDDILAAVKNLQGENDKLRGEIADLRNQQNTLREQVNGLPKPLTSEQAQNIAHTEAQAAATTAVDEAQRRNKKFSNIGIDIGPVYGPTRGEDYTVSGHAQFFSPFGGDGTHAVQAQGEYLYYPGQQEGQFDIGLVNRWGHLQAGGFGSFKYLSFNQYQNGGVLGQAAFLADYLFSRGRVGGFATKGFRNIAVLNNAPLGPNSFLQTYARVVDQYGVNALVGVWGNASIEGNIGYLRLNGPGNDRPGAMIRLVQPLNEHVSFTTEIGLNETLVDAHDHGRVVFGLEFGNFIRPKDYGSITTPVPMEVPRVRYQLLTRRVGNSPPVADAGADQIGVRPGTITLNGSASYDPDGDPLTFSWEQIGGPNVPISGANTAVATFPASSGQSYAFRLTVKDPAGAQSSARTTITVTAGPASASIERFDATPSTVPPGQAAILNWVVEGATSVTITPGIGSVNVRTGSSSVTPPQTTTYTLTATGPGGTVHASTTVTVGGTGVSTSGPQIVRFAASPETIQQGQQATLSWATNGATQVSISGVGTVGANGSTTVSPAQTTTYTLTAAGPNGQPVTAPVTVTVTSGTTGTLQIQSFTANPQSIAAGAASQLCWQVSGAASIAIQPSVGASLNPASGCASVSPAATTTYTLTATGASRQSVSSSVTVTVGTQPSPTGALSVLTFTANPGYTEFATNPSWLGWSTTNASYVVITGGGITSPKLPASGVFVVNPVTTTTYTLTAFGTNGQTTTATVSVFVKIPQTTP